MMYSAERAWGVLAVATKLSRLPSPDEYLMSKAALTVLKLVEENTLHVLTGELFASLK